MSPVSRDTPAGAAYLDLQRQAKASGRLTDELIQLYVLEGFISRLAASPVREKFVLKGGVLLAAFGNRRPTRDVDLAGLDLSNQAHTVLELVRSVFAVPLAADDGIEFDVLLGEVIEFADPVIIGATYGQTWDPEARRWG